MPPMEFYCVAWKSGRILAKSLIQGRSDSGQMDHLRWKKLPETNIRMHPKHPFKHVSVKLRLNSCEILTLP